MRPHCRRSPEPHELDGTPKADPQFRQKQSLTASVKTSEAVGQTGMPVFLAVRLLGSGCSHRGFGCERLQKAHSGLSLRSKAATESAVLTLEATGTQHMPQSGNLRLLVRVGRNVSPHPDRLHSTPVTKKLTSGNNCENQRNRQWSRSNRNSESDSVLTFS